MSRLSLIPLIAVLVACPPAERPDPNDSGPSATDASLQDSGQDPPDAGAIRDSGPLVDVGSPVSDGGTTADGGPDCDGHALGDSWPHEDGCNTCTCTENGIMCTLIHCPGDDCGDHRPGDSWDAGDGCNTCTCTEDGRVRCTLMVCPDDCGGRALGESWEHEDGCNTCSCTENGIVCTRRGCPPQGEEFTRCQISRECVVTKNTCCGVCGEPSLEDLQGVHAQRVQDLDEHLCGDPRPACPECVMMPPAGNLLALCLRSNCVVVDQYTDFTFDRCGGRVDECEVAANTCCPPCDQGFTRHNATAVSDDAALELRRTLCEGTTCEPCNRPRPAAEVEAYCNENRRCRLRPIGP